MRAAYHHPISPTWPVSPHLCSLGKLDRARFLHYEYRMLLPHPLPIGVGQPLGPLSGLFHHKIFCLSDCLHCLSPSSFCSSLTGLLAVLRHTSRFPPQDLFVLAVPSASQVPGAPSLTSCRSLLRCYLLSTAFPDPLFKSHSPLVPNPPDSLPCIRCCTALKTIRQMHFICLLVICPLHPPLACQHHESIGPPSCSLLYPRVRNRAWPTVGA